MLAVASVDGGRRFQHNNFFLYFYCRRNHKRGAGRDNAVTKPRAVKDNRRISSTRSILTAPGRSTSTFVTMIAKCVPKVDAETELKQVFKVFNRDKSRSINTKELRNIIKSLGENLMDKQIDKIIREADKDGNWTVNYKGSFLFQ